MSLGWLTESGLLPKESKKIKVESNSLVGLKAKILEHKSKLEVKKNQGSKRPIKREEKQEQKKNQKLKHSSYKLGHTEAIQISESLQEKAKIYENLKEKGEDKEQYVIDFQLSYIRKNQEESKEEEDRGEAYLSQMGAAQRWQEQERREWEERAQKEINAAEDSQLGDAVIIRSRPEVRQCWDNVLSTVQKSHLPEVIAQRKQYKRLKEAARQKKASNLQKRKKLIERLRNADN